MGEFMYLFSRKCKYCECKAPIHDFFIYWQELRLSGGMILTAELDHILQFCDMNETTDLKTTK